MAVAKVIEISSDSKKSFDDAIRKGIARASSTLEHVKGAWIKEQKIECAGGKVVGYRVHMMVSFVLDEPKGKR